MAKPLEKLSNKPFVPQNPQEKKSEPEMRYCPCGCGPIFPELERHMRCKFNDEWYCDILCAVKDMKAKWVGDRILDEGYLYTKAQWMQDREITDHG